MLKIGITGGIGSGKSVVCNIFRVLEIPVFDADREAKNLMNTDKELRDKIIHFFGKDAYNANNELQRQYISAMVFNNPEKLKQLNSIVHPVVIEYFPRWAERYRHLPYVIKEAAIMFESGSHRQNDYTIMVYADMETRINRVTRRDSISREQVFARMQNQMPEEEKKELSDFVIYNQEDSLLIPQVLELHRRFISSAND